MKTITMVPSNLLLRYFNLAQSRLQSIIHESSSSETSSLPTDPNLDWHRRRIVEAQLAALDEALTVGQQQQDSTISREDVQGVLRQIGQGVFSGVTCTTDIAECTEFAPPPVVPSTDGLRRRASKGSSTGTGTGGVDGQMQQTKNRQGMDVDDSGSSNSNERQQQLLTEAVEKTNELARHVFAYSILQLEWQLDHNSNSLLPQSGRDLKGSDDSIDEGTMLEYCGLMMAAVRLPGVQQYLQNGTAMPFTNSNDDNDTNPGTAVGSGSSVENRLLYIQKLYWRALGWESTHAMDQLKQIMSGDDDGDSASFVNNPKFMETFTKYASLMTVASTNAAMSNIGEGVDASNNDGTTRVVNVSYSEKVITYPSTIDGSMAMMTSQSTSAPTSNTIDEHKSTQQRQELSVAQQASQLQENIWSQFQSLPSHEQMKTVTKAKIANKDLMEKVANTPQGMDRVLLMQSIDGEVQKLLVIYKLWCSHNPGSE